MTLAKSALLIQLLVGTKHLPGGNPSRAIQWAAGSRRILQWRRMLTRKNKSSRNDGNAAKTAAAVKARQPCAEERTSAIGSADQEPVGLLHVARLNHVPQHPVRLEGQLPGWADDDARCPVAMRPLDPVQTLPGSVGQGRESDPLT